MYDTKIIVLGGGTSGWLTALFCRKYFPSTAITVIENASVGTIGVGEATTPQFISLLSELDIHVLDVIKETGGSIKNGISFENWNGDNKKYFHGFAEKNDLCPCNHCLTNYKKTLAQDKLDMNEYVYAAQLSYQNKVDLNNLLIALHIDTGKFGEYLKRIALERNIRCIDGNFSHVQVDEYDFITNVCLDGNLQLECDFVFDCSGFARLLIGNYYKVNWVSYKDFLPMKKAIAFPLEPEKDVKPYTQAIAMKYGWMWKLPLQDRIGAGYVFDSDYVEDEEVVDEAQQFLGQTIPNVRTIPFESGRYEQYWVKNCMAVGLASSFMEPLESTSIQNSVAQLWSLIENLKPHYAQKSRTSIDFSTHLFNRNDAHELDIAWYNHILTEEMDGAANFIYLHYFTKRSDTAFWSGFKQRNKSPKQIDRILKLIAENRVEEGRNLFGMQNYLAICTGLEIEMEPMDIDSLDISVTAYKNLVDTHVSGADNYKEWLKTVMI